MLIVQNPFFGLISYHFLFNVSELHLFCFMCLGLISIFKEEPPIGLYSSPSFLFDHINLYLILVKG